MYIHHFYDLQNIFSSLYPIPAEGTITVSLHNYTPLTLPPPHHINFLHNFHPDSSWMLSFRVQFYSSPHQHQHNKCLLSFFTCTRWEGDSLGGNLTTASRAKSVWTVQDQDTCMQSWWGEHLRTFPPIAILPGKQAIDKGISLIVQPQIKRRFG